MSVALTPVGAAARTGQRERFGFGRMSEEQHAVNRLLTGPQTKTGVIGGSRSGKTFLICRAIVKRALSAPGSRHAILRLKAAHAHASLWSDTLPAIRRVCAPWLEWTPREDIMRLTLPGKSEIWVGGLDDKQRIEKILGQEYVSIYRNECSQIPWASAVITETRLAQKVDRSDGRPLKPRFYDDLNPVGAMHWTKRLYIDGVEPGTNRKFSEAERADTAYAFLNPDANRQNLAAGYIEALDRLPERYRLRFRKGLYQPEVENALWTLEGLDATRLEPFVPGDRRLTRVGVGVDPSGSDGESDSQANDIGIVVAGKTHDGELVGLEDATCNKGPGGWAAVVDRMYKKWGADVVVAERNFGGAMVEAVLYGANKRMNVKVVTASRGKHVRAEPVAGLFADVPGVRAPVAHLAGAFPELEEELLQFSTAGYEGGESPNRADAFVWVATELMLDPESVDLGTWAKLGRRA